MVLGDYLKDFESLDPRALQLENLGNGIFKSIYLFTPSFSQATYGGQLVAHCTEAAYRTVDTSCMDIHSLQMKFVSAGKSNHDEPIIYSVKLLHNGRSFCIRLIKATQQEKTLLVAFASFHRRESSGIEHQICQPSCSKDFISSVNKKVSFSKYIEHLKKYNKTNNYNHLNDKVANIQYLNLMEKDVIRGSSPWDVWMRINDKSLKLLQSNTDIPDNRLHIIITCWLSDYIVAFASLLPHGFLNPSLRVITSLDHTIHFHHPECINVNDWFMYEVFSPWAAHNRGVNHGRMYGQDGKLWISTSQETLLRMEKNYVSKI